MTIHVTRTDGSVAGFPDDKEAEAKKYAEDVVGTIAHVSDETGDVIPEPEQPQAEQPLD